MNQRMTLRRQVQENCFDGVELSPRDFQGDTPTSQKFATGGWVVGRPTGISEGGRVGGGGGMKVRLAVEYLLATARRRAALRRARA
jgi:hypothetical protein